MVENNLLPNDFDGLKANTVFYQLKSIRNSIFSAK